jgi:transposase-like protein
MARKPTRIRRTFTPQFTRNAVALVHDGRSVNDVAHDLGIARSLQRWRTQLAREPEVAAIFPGPGRLAFYNPTRRHSSNAYRSPDEQEAQYAVRST